MRAREFEINLLHIKIIRTLIRWWGFPYLFQALMLAVFLSLTVLGFGVLPPSDINGKLFAKSNLVTLVIWGLWWPSMIWVAVLFGRVWCMVCPLELIANLTERFARWLRVEQRALGQWLRSGALMVVVYLGIQLLVAGVGLHRTPAYTSLFLITLLGMAAATGFLFKDRAFCRAFCPIGMLLNVYGRGGMLAVRPGSIVACSGCTDKGCLIASNRNKLDGRSCPSLLNPSLLASNKDCLVCGQCIKSCEPDNMRLILRQPFSAEDAREPMASWPLTLFIMLASGFVTSELTTESSIAQAAFVWIPEQAASFLQLSQYAGWLEGIWTLVLFPGLLWLLLGGLVALFRRSSIGDAWRRLALPLAVIVSAGHMSKAIAKFTSWVGFLPHALSDPSGIETAADIASHTVPSPTPLLNIHVASGIAFCLLLVGTLSALREVRLANPAYFRVHATPKFALAGLFAFIVMVWGM